MRPALLFLLLGFGPFGSPGHPVTQDAVYRGDSGPRSAERGVFYVPFKFYQRVVSPIDGATCPHRPTCSLYALQAIQRHGLVGLWLTVDRLLRSERSSALRLLPQVRDASGVHLLDPVEGSTFWFTSSR